MAKRLISLNDIKDGEPLPWSIYDERGSLMLREGFIIQGLQLLESLAYRGMYIEAEENEPEKKDSPPSVVRMLNQANEELQSLAKSYSSRADAPAKIVALTQLIASAVDINADVALATILSNKVANNYAIRHSIDAGILATLVAQVMGKSSDETTIIAAAALTMNLSMLGLQEKLLAQQDGPSQEEMADIKNHPQETVNLLQQSGVVEKDWLECVMHHHENEDGSGYNSGKVGHDIPQSSKIISLADRYSALTSARTYRKALLPQEALRSLHLESSKGIVDGKIAASFIKVIGVHPPGATVRLQNGDIAVVTQRGQSAATPIAYSIIGPRGAPLASPVRRDTADERYAIREAVYVESTNMPFNMQQLWGKEAVA